MREKFNEATRAQRLAENVYYSLFMYCHKGASS